MTFYTNFACKKKEQEQEQEQQEEEEEDEEEEDDDEAVAAAEAVVAEARGVMEERKGAETTAGVAPAARARWFRRLFRRRSGKK